MAVAAAAVAMEEAAVEEASVVTAAAAGVEAATAATAAMVPVVAVVQPAVEEAVQTAVLVVRLGWGSSVHSLCKRNHNLVAKFATYHLHCKRLCTGRRSSRFRSNSNTNFGQ
jgi:hypothetical protein